MPENSMQLHNHEDKTIFGFWVYLMTDLIMFAALFASYSVLKDNTVGGPGGKELFSLSGVLIQTLILLTSSFTCGLATLAVESKNLKQSVVWFSITLLLGLTFLTLELHEFSGLIAEGYSWQSNAFLSAFFSLVGFHGLHIAFGSLWIAVAIKQVISKGLTPFITSKLTRLSLFWHFLDIVWIFIFTIVYLYAHL